jgi:NAD(P)H-dependent flavin oxidoreductase YrpB (nitropropane dioxygenase family)
MSAFLERAGVELPIVQAGMGGGLAGHALAAAVAEAGGLGTIGFVAPADLRGEIASFRAASAKPLAVNILLPLARRAHFAAAEQADILVTFWGPPRRRTSKLWIHQCGSVGEAQEACRAGADAVIAQGTESGGHVRGTARAVELLARLRTALPRDFPVLSAGGVAEPADAAARLQAGADAVVCGTRFLMSEESGAHPDYKRRLIDAHETIVTELFGAGWPAPHRVVPNEATRRWVASDGRGPRWLRGFNRLSAPALSRLPLSMLPRLAATQSPGRPLFSPAAATADGPPNLVEAGPLYAGKCVARISDIRPAAELVRDLAQPEAPAR